MKPDCPACGGALRLTSQGKQVSRFCCIACNGRFRTQNGDPLEPMRGQPRLVKTRSSMLGDDLLALILTSHDLSHVEIQRRYGISRERVRRIRIGAAYPDRCPHLERWPSPSRQASCKNCINWRHHHDAPFCAFGFPDPLELSTYFASECLQYQPTPAA